LAAFLHVCVCTFRRLKNKIEFRPPQLAILILIMCSSGALLGANSYGTGPDLHSLHWELTDTGKEQGVQMGLLLLISYLSGLWEVILINAVRCHVANT
jgi:hypothetical protein